jgi:cytochrome b561
MLPAATPGWEKVIVHFAHIGLYLVTFAAIFSGWLLAGALTPPLDVSIFGLVGLPTIDAGLSRKLVKEGHEILANLLMLMVVVHVAAALYHHFVRKDSVLRRMLLRGRNRQRA